MNVIRTGSVWSSEDSTRALTSPNDVHHSVNLSNTKFITYNYTSFYQVFLKIFKHLFLNIFKMSIQTSFPPVFADEVVRRFTQE